MPFVSKAQGQPLAKIAAKVMAGKSLAELGFVEPTPPKHVSVKEVVFPFSKFPGVDVILGPEMRSTGEVMGIDADFPHRVRQEPDRRGDDIAVKRQRVYFRAAGGQAGDLADRQGLQRNGISDFRDRRDA